MDDVASRGIRMLARFSLLTCLSLLLGLTSFLKAQTTATLLGHAVDTTGAIIPGAKIVVRNVGTNASRETIADMNGNYIVPQLPVGTYSATATMKGFESKVITDLTLSLGQNLRVDFVLSPGQVTESVTVNGSDVAQVDTHSASMSSEIEQTRVVDLPLNGRDPASLLGLIPGVSTLSVPTTPGITGDTATVNGTNASANEIIIDGLPFNAVQRSDGDPLPPPDMFQEFRVMTNSYSAEFGRNGGAVIIGATRSGTNQFHGSTWEFLRNNVLNTKDYFATKIPVLRQNQFGAAAGGPIILPHYNGRNRTYFYGGYQGTRIIQDVLASSAIPPNANELQGIFPSSNPIIDPTTGLEFPNNTIPSYRFDSAALAVLKIVPPANQPNGDYYTQLAQPTNANEYLIRVDHQLFKNNTLTGRMWEQHNSSTYPFGANTASNIPYTPGILSVQIYSGELSDTQVITTNLINRLTTGYLRRDENRFNTVLENASVFGIQIAPPIQPFLPNITVNGRLSLQATINGQPTKLDNVFSVFDTVNWTHRDHEFAVGMSWEKPSFTGQPVYDNGTFVFDGSRTKASSVSGSGNSLADFFLGLPYSFNQATARFDNDRYQYFGFFAQDDWKVARKLTVNLGMRYEYAPPMYNIHGFHGTFEPNVQSNRYPTAPLGLLYPGDQGLPRSLYHKEMDRFAPRVGFAYDPKGDGRTSIRGAYGVFFQILDAEFSQYMNGNLPFELNITLVDPASFSKPWGSAYQGGVNDPVTVYRQNLTSASPDFVYPSGAWSIDPNIRNGYVQQFNLSVQRQGPWRTLVQAAYVGTLGHKLGLAYDMNAGIYNPASPATPVNSTRPYDAGELTNIERFISGNSSNYNALQLSFNRQYSGGIVISSTYTYAKSFDRFSAAGIAETSNPFNLRFDRSLSDFDRAQVFNASAVWQLPYLLASPNWFLKSVVAGWQLSGLTEEESGLPFSVTDGQDISHTGVGLDRPNILGNPRLSTSRSHVAKVAEYFNTAEFATQPVGTFGDARRNLMFGPGYANVDVAMLKDFRVTEGSGFQFRAEAFNLLNRVNLSNPNGSMSAGASFGRITSDISPRLIQLALKFHF
jgi:hypothetical protein